MKGGRREGRPDAGPGGRSDRLTYRRVVSIPAVFVEHDDGGDGVIPDEAPKVPHRLRKRHLRRDIRVLWVLTIKQFLNKEK